MFKMKEEEQFSLKKLFPSMFFSSREMREDDNDDDEWMEEWMNGGVWGPKKGVFLFLLCIKFTRIMVITLLTLHLPLQQKKKFFFFNITRGAILVVSWAYKGKTLSDGEGSFIRLPSQLSSVNI